MNPELTRNFYYWLTYCIKYFIAVLPNRSTKLASTIRLAEVDDYRLDKAMLCEETMMHECSSCCMRNKKGKKNAQRLCRAGAGDEATKNKNDTPGFPLTDNPMMSLDHHKIHPPFSVDLR